MCKLFLGLLNCSVFDAPSHSQLIRDKYTCTVDKDLAHRISCPALLNQVSSVGSESDWKEDSHVLCDPRALLSYGSQRVHEAFHLLQTEPSVQVPNVVDNYISVVQLHEFSFHKPRSILC